MDLERVNTSPQEETVATRHWVILWQMEVSMRYKTPWVFPGGESWIVRMFNSNKNKLLKHNSSSPKYSSFLGVFVLPIFWGISSWVDSPNIYLEAFNVLSLDTELSLPTESLVILSWGHLCVSTHPQSLYFQPLHPYIYLQLLLTQVTIDACTWLIHHVLNQCLWYLSSDYFNSMGF